MPVPEKPDEAPEPWVRASLARVLDGDGGVQGAAFVTGERTLCTCAHVVLDALKLPRSTSSNPAEALFVDFPFIGPDRYEVAIEGWIPLEEDGSGDIACLKIVGRHPAGAVAVRFVGDGDHFQASVCVYGFPRGADLGVWAYGRLADARADGTQQLIGSDRQNYWLEPGFSGAPVWDMGQRAVVGMAVAYESDASLQVGMLLPSKQLRRALPSIQTLDSVRPFIDFTRGIERVRSPAGLEQFLREYLGTPGQPVPFSGREGQFGTLDQWLGDDSKPFAAVIAPAGRGKSALLARWADYLQSSTKAAVALIPMSVRFGTATREATLGMLGARLRSVLGTRADLPSDSSGWLAEVDAALRQPRDSGALPLVVILDGLDEAVGWDPVQELRFPTTLGAGVKVLVAARQLVERDAKQWLDELGWNGSAATVAMPPLEARGVQQTLRAFAADRLTSDQIQLLSDKLIRLTEGDPLLVRLYVDHVSSDGISSGLALDLDSIRPGLEGYLERWWRDQRKIWAGASPLKESNTRVLLALLATAFGPLAIGDIVELTAKREALDPLAISDLLQPLGRMVIGGVDGAPFVFSHSRLRDYFGSRLGDDEWAASEWETRFLEYGARVLARLEGNARVRRSVPPYCLESYRRHLERANAPLEAFAALLIPEWLSAWEAHEGAFSGFLGDLDATCDRAARAVIENGKDSIRVLCRAAVLRASINTLVSNLPPAVPAALLRAGLWSPQQALSYARCSTDRHLAIVTLGAISPHLDETLLLEAIAIVEDDEPGFFRDKAMLNLVEPTIASGNCALALKLSASIEDLLDQGDALTTVSKHYMALGDESSAIEAVRSIRNSWSVANALKELACVAGGAALQEMLEIARALQHDRDLALVMLAPFLPRADRIAVLEDALTEPGVYFHGSQEVFSLLRMLEPEEQQSAIAMARRGAEQIEDSDKRRSILSTLDDIGDTNGPSAGQDHGREHSWSRLVRSNSFDKILASLGTGEELRRYDVRGLAAVFAQLPAEYQERALKQAVESLSSEAGGRYVAADYLVLSALANVEEAETLYERGMAALAATPKERDLAEFLKYFPGRDTDHGHSNVFDATGGKLIGAVREGRRQREKDVLRSLDARYPGRIGSDILRLCLVEKLDSESRSSERDPRGRVISYIAPFLAPSDRDLALDTALKLPSTQAYLWDLMHDQLDGREAALSGLAPHLDAAQLRRLVEETRCLDVEEHEVSAVAHFASSLMQDGDCKEAIDLISQIENADLVARWLGGEFPGLSEDTVVALFDVARTLSRGAIDHGAAGLAQKLVDLRCTESRALLLASELGSLVENPAIRIEVLCIAAPRFDKVVRAELFGQVFDLLQRFADPSDLIWRLKLECLPEELQSRFLDWMLGVADPRVRTEILCKHAVAFAPALVRIAMADATKVATTVDVNDYFGASTVKEVAGALWRAGRPSEAIVIVRRLPHDRTDDVVRDEPELAAAAGLKPSHGLENASDLSSTFEAESDDRIQRASLMSRVAELTVEELKEYFAGRSGARRDLEADIPLLERLGALGSADQALEIIERHGARDYANGYALCHCLQAIAPMLPSDSLQRALNLAGSISGGRFARSGMLIAIIGRIGELHGAEAAFGLLKELPEWDRVKAYECLLPFARNTGQVLSAILYDVMSFSYESSYDRGENPLADGLSFLAPHLASAEPSSVRQVLPDILKSLATRRRRLTISGLESLLPVFRALGGGRAVDGIAREILSVTSWFATRPARG
jgi:hypothetical protein